MNYTTETLKLLPEETGVALITAERARQITEEKWSPNHDDTSHADGSLTLAAVSYTLSSQRDKDFRIEGLSVGQLIERFWPMDVEWFKPGDPIRDLTKAGALIAAEIDRLQRRAKLLQRAELGVDGDNGFALLGPNLQEGEAEFVEIPKVDPGQLPRTRHEQFTGEDEQRLQLANTLWACREAHRKLRVRLGCPGLTHLFYFGPSHPYGKD